MRALVVLTLLIASTEAALAHDTWVQTNTNRAQVGDVVHVDLMLGNHGNEHRDFKLASKITLEPCSLSVIDPEGKTHDLKAKVVDTGYAPKEGYWSARFVSVTSGLHVVSHTLNTLHSKTRAIKSGKTYFTATMSLDKPSENPGRFNKPLGHAIELVPLTDPSTAVAGQPIRVQVLYQGKPLSDARVSFIPRGQVLEDGFDESFERKTDAEGKASFVPPEGNYLLIVVHHAAPDQKGDGYDKTHYSATLTFNVPQISSPADRPSAVGGAR